MVESNSKRGGMENNTGGVNNTDRISSLPDSMLCHILSFVPTKTCVQTSLLSRRWQRIWENIQVLDFHDDFYNEFESFSVFVNGVLARRRSRDIQKIDLSCGYSHEDMFYANSVTTWVCTAIGPKLEEFCLNLNSGDGQSFVMPSTLFTCINLHSISLCGGIHVNVQKNSKIYLPSLKKLKLSINYVDSLETLLSCCPNLESLDILFTTDSAARIHMPHSLKSLEFCIENDRAVYLEIDAPNLKKFKIISITCGSFTVNNLSNIVEAVLDVYSAEVPPNTLLNLLKAISKTRTLDLCSQTTKWLLRASGLNFPEFCNLASLDIILPFFNSNFVMNLLSKCPRVEILMIKIEKEPPTFWPCWVQPTNVPRCLLSKLGSIYIEGFQGYTDEVAFVNYLLRNGLVLQILTLECYNFLDMGTRLQIIQKLSVVQRGSNMCDFTMV